MRVAGEVARVLNAAIVERGFIVEIQGRQHPTIEAWLLLADLVGVRTVIRWCRPITVEATGEVIGWEARCELMDRDGLTVGGAEAMALREEQDGARKRSWTASQHAMRSMAETRATSKALSLRFRHVVKLAGYESSEADERNGEHEGRVPTPYSRPGERAAGADATGRDEDAPGSVSLEREAEVANRLTAIGITDYVPWLSACKVPTRYHLSHDEVWKRVTEALELAEAEVARADADEAAKAAEAGDELDAQAVDATADDAG
jgi:hypothetical protein